MSPDQMIDPFHWWRHRAVSPSCLVSLLKMALTQGGLTILCMEHSRLTFKPSALNFLSLVPRLIRATWLWDKLLPLQHLESGCPWVSPWSTEDWLPLTIYSHRKPCFINRCPLPPPHQPFDGPRKPGVCLKGCGIQTKRPLPPTSYRNLCTESQPHLLLSLGSIAGPDLRVEQKA